MVISIDDTLQLRFVSSQQIQTSCNYYWSVSLVVFIYNRYWYKLWFVDLDRCACFNCNCCGASWCCATLTLLSSLCPEQVLFAKRRLYEDIHERKHTLTERERDCLFFFIYSKCVCWAQNTFTAFFTDNVLPLYRSVCCFKIPTGKWMWMFACKHVERDSVCCCCFCFFSFSALSLSLAWGVSIQFTRFNDRLNY